MCHTSAQPADGLPQHPGGPGSGVWSEQAGKLSGRQETLAEQLTERFGPLDESVTQRLASASLDELKHWSRRILSAQTLDEVFRLQ